MSNHFDELSKSLAEKPLPRRQSLRLLGAAIGGALLSPLGAATSWAGPPDPCKQFCNVQPRSARAWCLEICRACSGGASRMCGSGWNLSCCASGAACCNGYCADLSSDFDHCGACGDPCDYPGPYEDGACVDGHCFYWCVEGATDCGDGTCTDLLYDPDNCGACGNVCDESTPECFRGTCRELECPLGATNCDGVCVYLDWDRYNCGACGYVCSTSHCVEGVCTYEDAPPDDGFGNPQVGESYDD